MATPIHGKKKRLRCPRLTRLAVALAIAGAIGGGGTWFGYHYVFKAVFAEVVPGAVYRSGQPSPADLRHWVQRYHIRTVISLRGGTVPEVVAEKKVADELGVRVIYLDFNAGHLPPPQKLQTLIDALETAPRPILVHCRNGVDRTGMASAVAALVVGKVGLEKALKQLPWLRVNREPDHVSDMLGQYQSYCRSAELPDVNRDDPETFKTWVREVYEGEPQFDTQLVPRIPLWPGSATNN